MILLSILIIILALIGWFVHAQWNNITAIVDTFRYSQEEVQQKLEENKQELQAYIEQNEDINVRDLTEEEKEALNKGELTEEEAISIITGKLSMDDVHKDEQSPSTPPQSVPTQTEDPTNAQVPAENKPTDTTTPPQESQPQKTTGEVVSELIAKLYVEKNKYLSSLSGMETQVIDEYNALPKDQKESGKKAIISKYMTMVANWETECDGVVYGILDEIKAALANSGQDQSIVQKIEQAYLNEKRLKKAYYMNIYLDVSK